MTKKQQTGQCYCLQLADMLRMYFTCNACFNSLTEDKNTLVRENQRLRLEIQQLKKETIPIG